MEYHSPKFRKHLRIEGFDYRSNLAYFVTVCASHRQHVFGEIVDGKMQPTRRGLVAKQSWDDIPTHHEFAELDAFVLMPNHIHGIICIVGNDAPVAATPASPRRRAHGPASRSLSSVVGSFKAAVTRKINKLRTGAGNHFWQENFWEHIIRSDRALMAVRDYIERNPARWLSDEENESGTGEDRLADFFRNLEQLEDQHGGDAGVAATVV